MLRYFIKHTPKKVLVSAPTGLAAINISGVTLHSLFGLEPTIQNIANAKINHKKLELFRAANTLIIDEIPMVRSDVLDMIDHLLQLYRSTNSPFGGCQIIAFGDPLQLPSIAKTKDEREYFLANYGSVFFFSAPCYPVYQAYTGRLPGTCPGLALIMQ